MPIYTYHCENCEVEFEKYQSFSEDSLITCPECGYDALRKVYSPALVVFKGSGFYVTDTKSSSALVNSSNHKDSKIEPDKTSGENHKDEKKAEPKAEKKKKPAAEKEK